MSHPILDGLDETIRKAMEDMNVPGAQVAIIRNGDVIYSEAFGYANVDEHVPLTKEHYLPIGSSSKSFTAAAALILAQQGKLDLDKPIRHYMPEFELADPVATAQATARDLLCHRTGVPRHDMMWLNWDDLDRRDLALNRVKHLQGNLPFRSGWQYQNQMYAVIGQLIEAIDGRTWETFVEEEILGPLGIRDYSFRIPYPHEEYARLYTPDGEGGNKENVPLIIDAMGPAGSLNMKIGGLAAWVAFQLNEGRIEGKPLIDAALFKQLHKPVIPYQILPFEFPERVTAGYGLGWTVDFFRGHKVVDHGGNVSGGSALISFMPDLGLGCAVLTNANSNLFVTALSMELYDRALGHAGERNWFIQYRDNMNGLLDAMKSRLTAIYGTKIEGRPCSHELEEYAGEYEHPGYGGVTITAKDGGLHMKYHNNEMKVSHLHYDIFTFELFGGPHPLSFATGVDGGISSLSIPFEPSVDPIVFARQ
ncbi:serine hydrolase [Saccharibacillus sp. CPCC 101409]|uniref:serine hydrolase n=1 Tax=Saccharibacillus sp. CPCC 101409 TaxID=3058041 RepID=UPI0026710CA6|nr:serine hydrolase [Saccharibacillus sp. CPCC 101409]MDO3408949.1 serine hydrolase [Saccharibacillus sp. CPCC 101409]